MTESGLVSLDKLHSIQVSRFHHGKNKSKAGELFGSPEISIVSWWVEGLTGQMRLASHLQCRTSLRLWRFSTPPPARAPASPARVPESRPASWRRRSFLEVSRVRSRQTKQLEAVLFFLLIDSGFKYLSECIIRIRVRVGVTRV